MYDKIEINSMDRNSPFKVRDVLYEIINPEIIKKRPIIFLCIGTDRSTGDSLGPIIGDKLKFLVRNKVILYGNLENPVHAKNLKQVIDEIEYTYNNPFIVAIDACLGNIQNVGKIFIEKKPLLPGAAVNKNLPPIGDLSITGVVNVCGNLEFMILQNTRLYTVMKLADVISRGIYHSLLKSLEENKVSSYS